MKYVRTKDGELGYMDEFGNCCFKTWWCCYESSFKDDFKYADTIEELCDEFVGIDSQGHYIIHNDEWLDGARIIPLEEVNYYGAIWTDKGLIYVAKMNEKGELELL